MTGRAGPPNPAPARDPAPWRPVSDSVAAVARLDLVRVVAVAAWAYPLLVAAGPYVAWLVAWGALGRRPVPLLDDPTSIGVVVDIPYYASGLLLVGSPAAFFVGLAATWACATRRRVGVGGIVALGLALAVVWAGTIAMARWDPLGVIYWYWD